MNEDQTLCGALRRMIAFLAAATVLMLGIIAKGETVRLHAEAGSKGPAIRLADIAELDGARAEVLGDTVVATFDPKARETRITLDIVRDSLSKANVNWGIVSLKGFSTCRVHRLGEPEMPADVDPTEAQPIASNLETEVTLNSSANLRAMVLDELAKFATASLEDLRITFSERDERLLKQASLTDRFEIEPKSASRLGRVPVTVRRFRGPELVETLNLTADLERRATAVVAKQSIAKGAAFTSDNLEVREVYLRDERGTPVSELKLAVGQASAMQLRSGAVVYPDAIESPLVVRRGELVTVQCMSGGLSIRTVARSNSDGRVGDVIEVRNEATRQSYSATVSGLREATIRVGVAAELPDAAANLEGSNG